MLISADPLMILRSQLSFSLLWIVLVALISFATSLFSSKSSLNMLNGTNGDTGLLWDVTIDFSPVWKPSAYVSTFGPLSAEVRHCSSACIESAHCWRCCWDPAQQMWLEDAGEDASG